MECPWRSSATRWNRNWATRSRRSLEPSQWHPTRQCRSPVHFRTGIRGTSGQIRLHPRSSDTNPTLMAFGPPLVIGEEFAHLEGVESIHIYGSWASRYDGTTGPTPYDVGVLVIGTPNRDAVYDAARRSQERLGREVNVTQRTTEQWESASDDFSQQLRASPMVDVPYPSRDAEKEQGQ